VVLHLKESQCCLTHDLCKLPLNTLLILATIMKYRAVKAFSTVIVTPKFKLNTFYKLIFKWFILFLILYCYKF